MSFGFFRDTIQFQRKMMYWHVIPSATELGFCCPGKSATELLDTYEEGIQIQDHLVFVSAAAELARCRAAK
jgi:hypothetical protein